MSLSLLPMASLSLHSCTSIGIKSRTSVKISSNSSSRSSSSLQSSFLSTSASLTFPSSFSGLSLGIDLRASAPIREKPRRLVITAAGRQLLCMTKRNRSGKSLAHTHGFRRRMRTTSGRAVLQRRRAKGRKILCTKSHPNRSK